MVFGLPLAPDDITNSISVIVVLASLFYGIKIVRLSRGYEFVALKGGRAPYYIIAGVSFLLLGRVSDLLTNYFSYIFGMQLALTFNDPPEMLSAIFIFLGLREMYVVYRKGLKLKSSLPVSSAEEIWGTETKSEDALSS